MVRLCSDVTVSSVSKSETGRKYLHIRCGGLMGPKEQLKPGYIFNNDNVTARNDRTVNIGRGYLETVLPMIHRWGYSYSVFSSVSYYTPSCLLYKCLYTLTCG